MLCCSGHLEQRGGRRLSQCIQAFLKQDRVDCAARVANTIEAKLARGDVQEAFRHLKGGIGLQRRCRPRPAISQWSVRLPSGWTYR